MRQTAVAGQFYPLGHKELKKELNRCFKDLEIRERDARGAVVPHAGYIYSGAVAAHAYALLPKADTYVLFGPNHTGYGSAVALSQETWTTPLGIVDTDRDIGKLLAGTIVDFDELAHRYEHSIEVQLPFLQYRFENEFRILPICMGLQDEETAVEVGKEVSLAAKASGKSVVFIASSDLTHYQPAKIASDNDRYLLEAVIRGDIPEFYRRREERNITACGFGPIAAMLTAAREFGASNVSLLRYANSGDVSGDYSQVVGYAALIVE
ncbi:MAG: MEMO1 family protein [Methanosarcinaceae archaeon]|nr:MEMO1 family protein [Methanosarcinaceae archaeon]